MTNVRADIKEGSDLGLFIQGPAGSGKTHLAAAIVRDVIERGGEISFRTYQQLLQAIRSLPTNPRALSDYVEAPLLVLDDLGTGSLSDHERRYTLEVLDSRLNANRPTIITSNWDLEQIRQGFDERIASRLATFKRLNFDGQDRRKGRKSA